MGRTQLGPIEIVGLVILTLSAMFVGPAEVVAQGSIFGAVAGTGGGAPADGAVSFVGFLDGTDEEIRLEICVGAGYGEGHWFDDFQNYLTEAPGVAYEYHFFASAGDEGFVLEGVVPDNSYEQEDVGLVAGSWPAAPQGFGGNLVGGEIHLRWDFAAGNSYHVYRRRAPSGGSFFRVDVGPDETDDPGLADSTFIDLNIAPTATYEYVVVAEDAQGILGPHSVVLMVTPGGGCCQIRGDVNSSGSDMLDISDLIYLVNYMFQSGLEPACMEQADINGDGGAAIDISDLIYLVNYMFQGGPPLPACL